MGDRFVVIIVSLLTLIVMCGLLLAALVWVPERIDQLEKRLDRLDELSAQVSAMHDQLSDLDKLEKKLSETALAAAPLGRIDSSLDEVNKKLNEVLVPAVNDIKGRMAARSDVDRVVAKMNQITQQVAAAAKTDPKLTKLAASVAELKQLVEATRKKLDTTSRSVTKDLKALHLELQKIKELMKRSGTETAVAE